MDAIRIRTERAVLEIRSEPAKVTVTNDRPQFRVRRQRPRMRITREAPRFKVNWMEIRSQISGKPPIRYARDIATEAQQKAMDAIGTIAQEGTRAMHIERGETWPRIIRDRLRKALPELNIGLVPKDGPKIQWEGGNISIEWDDITFEMEWDMGSGMTIEVEPHSVEVTLRNRPSVQIWVERDEKTGEIIPQQAIKQEQKQKKLNARNG